MIGHEIRVPLTLSQIEILRDLCANKISGMTTVDREESRVRSQIYLAFKTLEEALPK